MEGRERSGRGEEGVDWREGGRTESGGASLTLSFFFASR